MPTRLCIQVFSNSKVLKEEIEFFKSDQWTTETEEVLLQRLHELLIVIRPLGTSLNVELNVEVTDLITASLIINKKLKNELEINHHKLSVREIEVLSFIMLGYTTQEIADKLFVSYETVKSHRKNILEKTGAKNTASLINYYHQTFFDK